MEKPDYVPPQIWEAAIFLLDANANLNVKSAKAGSDNLKRLLFDTSQTGKTYARDLARTWKRVVVELDPHDIKLSEKQNEPRGLAFRIFLAIVSEFTESIDAGMRPALDEGYKKIKRIADLARQLAQEWGDLDDLREQKAIEFISEYELLTKWAEKAHCRIGGDNWRDFPRLSDLLDSIGNAAEFLPLRPPRHHEYATLGAGGTRGFYDSSALVCHFDEIIANHKRFALPEDFKVGNTDMARLLSALLQQEIDVHLVNSARNRKTYATSWGN